MTSPASGSPPTPVMCAQKSLDNTEIRENRMIEFISDMQPEYRQTPVPKRKLTRISESVTVSPSSSNLPHADSQVHCKSKLSSYKSQLWTHEGEGQTIDSNNTTTDCMVHPTVDKNTMPTLMDKKSEDTSSQPQYCNMDMLDALSVHDVYTIWTHLAIEENDCISPILQNINHVQSRGGISSQVVQCLLDKSILWISFLKRLYRGNDSSRMWQVCHPWCKLWLLLFTYVESDKKFISGINNDHYGPCV